MFCLASSHGHLVLLMTGRRTGVSSGMMFVLSFMNIDQLIFIMMENSLVKGQTDRQMGHTVCLGYRPQMKKHCLLGSPQKIYVSYKF
jgi:hypothetical protein